MRVTIDGEGFEVAEISEQAHKVVHLDSATSTEKGMATVIMALCDALEPSIEVTLLIDNFYEDGEKIKTTVETSVPAPPLDADEREEWEQDHIMPHTGTGRPEGDSAYFVTVASSSRPDLIPVGTEYEFGT